LLLIRIRSNIAAVHSEFIDNLDYVMCDLGSTVDEAIRLLIFLAII